MKRYLDLDYKRIDKRLQSLPNRKISRIFNRVVISKLEVIRETLLEIKEEGGHDDIYDFLFLKKINSMEKELKKMAKIVKTHQK